MHEKNNAPAGGPEARPPMRLKGMGSTIKRLIGYLMKYRVRLLIVFVSVIVGAVCATMGLTFMQKLIDDYIAPLLGVSDPDFGPLLGGILQMAVIYYVGVAATLIYSRLMVKIGQHVLKDVRDEMFDRMQTFPIRYFDRNANGDIMSHYTNDTDTLRQAISVVLPQFMNSFVTIVVVFVSMVRISLPLTILELGVVALMLWSTKKIGGKSTRYFVAQQQDLGNVNGYIEEMMDGQKVVKVFCREERSQADFDKLNDKLLDSATNANNLAQMMMPLMANLGNLGYVLIAIVGGAIAIYGNTGLTLGGIAAFLALSKSFTMPIGMISNQASSIIMAIAGANRIFRLMDEEPEQDGGTITLTFVEKTPDGGLRPTEKRTDMWAWKMQQNADTVLVRARMDGDTVVEDRDGPLWAWRITRPGVRILKPTTGTVFPDGENSYELVELRGRIELMDVDFGYTPEKQVLHDISIHAKQGQKIALVGHTGAGKTTITNLLNRFYDIQDGVILYDGINVLDIRKPDLRRALGIVLQDTHLFTGTVMDNIRYGRLDATDEECIAAAKLANAHDFIELLPEGYETVIAGDGAGLSQGQKQLLNIARCAVADPPVMILDEATSSIDTRTEALVQAGMDALMEGRTVFIIAHRLSTVQNSDAIMVMDGGRIIERGSHDQLMAEKGVYYRLYTGAVELE